MTSSKLMMMIMMMRRRQYSDITISSSSPSRKKYRLSRGTIGIKRRGLNYDVHLHLPRSTGSDRWVYYPRIIWFIAVFSSAGSGVPDVSSRLLILSGDIETNPGPKCAKCQAAIRTSGPFLTCASSNCDARCHLQQRCSALPRSQQRSRSWFCPTCRTTPTGNATGSTNLTVTNNAPTSTTSTQQTGNTSSSISVTCFVCLRSLRRGANYYTCSCGAVCHRMAKCSGISRYQPNSNWSCTNCLGLSHQSQATPTFTQQPQPTLAGRPVASLPGQSQTRAAKCPACNKSLRNSGRRLECSMCNTLYHHTCAHRTATRDQVETLLAANAWICPACTSQTSPANQQSVSSPKTAKDKQSAFIQRGCLRVLQWNANGLKTKTLELVDALKSLDIDICCIQETKLCAKDRMPRFAGYTAIRLDRANDQSGGGLAMLVKADIPYSPAPALIGDSSHTTTESQAIRILTPTGHLFLVNAYAPPSRSPITVSFDVNNLPHSREHIIFADLNCHSALWDYNQPSDALGQKLEDWLIDNDFNVANDGSATRLNPATCNESCPDVTLMHNSLLSQTDWSITNDLGSDHLPILCVINCSVSTTEHSLAKPYLRWHWKAADWEAFTASVEESCDQGPSPDNSIKAASDHLTSSILAAAEKHIGRVAVRSTNKPWMTPPLRAAIKRRNRLRRARDPGWINACQEVREMTLQAKTEKWEDFLESLDLHTDSSKVWRTVKSLSGSPRPSGATNCAIMHNDRDLHSDQAKAHAFIAHYADVSRLQISSEERRSVNLPARKALFSPSADTVEARDFTMSELNTAIAAAKSKGAAGPDQISPSFLKHLGPIAKSYFLYIINCSWHSGTCPQSWRTAHIIPILKPNKPASSIKSYRPVSLTSCIAKVSERMVYERLMYIAESRHLLSDDQAGFRRLRSTEDQVLRITQSISDGFQCKPPRRTVLALIDFSQAFDTVWRQKLIHVLLDNGIPATMVRWIYGFLRNRLARVSFNNKLSKIRRFLHGVPQGSVLAPLLFLFFINTLRAAVPDGINISLYADDVAIWYSHPDKDVATILVQEALDNIHQWIVDNKLLINVAKCEVSLFSTSGKEVGWQPQLYIGGTQITVNPTPTFLGVILDVSLSFVPHVDNTVRKVKEKTRVLRHLSTKEWGWTQDKLRQVYISYIRSVIDYCAPAWQPWLSETQFHKLERAQNDAIRAVTGQLRTTPVEALHCEANIPTYKTWSDRRCLIAYERSMRLPTTNPRNALASENVHQRIKRNNWRRQATQLTVMYNIPSDRAPLQLLSEAPWQLADPPLSVFTHISADSQVETIYNHKVDFHIYTDGCVLISSNYSSGSAAIICSSHSVEAPQVLSRLTSSSTDQVTPLDAEVAAISLAMSWLQDQDCDPSCAILCDSKSVVEAVSKARLSSQEQSPAINSVRRFLSDHPQVILQLVRGHSGLPGNEAAHQAAFTAAKDLMTNCNTTAGSTPVTYSAIKHYINSTIHDPPPQHARTASVYSHDTFHTDTSLSRRDQVLLAQLRSGHCHKLAAYHNVIDPTADPSCQRCSLASHTLEHWLQECPATASKRFQILGEVDPPLSILVTDQQEVILFARETLP